MANKLTEISRDNNHYGQFQHSLAPPEINLILLEKFIRFPLSFTFNKTYIKERLLPKYKICVYMRANYA